MVASKSQARRHHPVSVVNLHHSSVAIVVFALIAGGVSIAFAESTADGEEGASDLYVTDAALELDDTDRSADDWVSKLNRRFGLEIVDPDRWEAADLESLARGAATLPPVTWEKIEGPIRIEYGERRCMFSMGRYNERCPTFGDDRRHWFIYDPAPLHGKGPVARLEMLTAEEQRDIQLRRAVVHLAMIDLDDSFGWSEQSRWRTINGWSDGSDEPLNNDPWGYSRYLGMRSARLDLATFAEEFLVRPEDLLLERAEDSEDYRRRVADVDPNQTVVCQQFTRRRVLNDMLEELDGDWREPRRNLPHIEAGEPTCPAFEQWARPDDLDGFDLLLAAATADQPESLFGHLLLHVRYDGDGEVRGAGFEPVYQFGAITDQNIDPVEYLTRGLLGGFPSILELNTFRGIDRLFLQYQQRDLRRYRLNLTDEQSLRVLERIWEGERRIRYPYLFLSDNCASFLIDLLAPALELPLPERQGGIKMPTDVLDTLAEIDNGDLGALLEKRPGTLRSNRHVAEEAVLQRRALTEKLSQAIDPDERPDEHREFDEIVADLDSLDPDERHRAYRRLSSFFDRLLADEPELVQAVIDFVYHSVLVERYFMEMAHFARRTVYAQAQSNPTPRTTEDILERRRDIYRNEDMQARMEAFNEMAMEAEQVLTEGPDREWTEEEERILEYEEQIRETYMTVLGAQSQLIDRHKSDWSGVEYLDERSQAYRDAERRLDESSVEPSGRNRIAIGAGWGTTATEHAGVTGSYSLMEDRLGEIRRRGYRGDLGIRLLGLDATIPVVARPHEEMSLELILVEYQSLRQTHGPIRDGFFDRIGWSIDARIAHDGRRDLWGSAELTPSILFPLLTSTENVNHLVARAGLGIRYDIHRDQNPLVGADVGLFAQIHLYGDFANVVRFGASTGQFTEFGPRWRYDVRAEAESRHHLFELRQRPVMAVPFVESLWTNRDYREDAPADGFRTWRAGLRLEHAF